jgi:dTDP-4-amino-4,6-dideoxygalactose transaminase
MTRDQLQAHLKDKGIVSGVYYPKPLHLHPHFAKMGYQPGDFPVAEKVSRQVLSLPVHPGLSQEEIERVCHEIRIALK